MSSWLAFLCKAVFATAIVNEVRGAILALPVLWTMYQSGGTVMAVWLGFCSLAGIALSVAVPVYGGRWAKRRFSRALA
jgi:hypothetical protein